MTLDVLGLVLQSNVSILALAAGNSHEGKIFLRHILSLYLKWFNYQVRINPKQRDEDE